LPDAIVRRVSVPTNGNRTELTPDLAEALIVRCGLCPDLETIARAELVEPERLKGWLREGQSPGASAMLADFSARFLQADAEVKQALFLGAMKAAKGRDSRSIIAMLDQRREALISETVTPSAEELAQRWIDARDPALIDFLREAEVLPTLLDEVTVAQDDVRARLIALGWSPPVEASEAVTE
jgi:hypothetical protein